MSTCERSELVEAAFDGRLGVNERASTERHCKTCAPCTQILADLTSLRRDLRATARPITPLDHQRARLALLRHAATPALAEKRRRPIAILAAAFVLVPVAVWAAATTVSTRHVDEHVVAPVATHPSASPAAASAPSPAPFAPPVTTAAEPEASPPPSSPPAHRTSSARSAHSDASTAFADAMDAIARGDFGAGASKLERFATEHPSDPRTEEALYLQAIALERAGRIGDAKAVAGRYLAAYPSGSHRAQAQRLSEK